MDQLLGHHTQWVVRRKLCDPAFGEASPSFLGSQKKIKLDLSSDCSSHVSDWKAIEDLFAATASYCHCRLLFGTNLHY